MLLLNVESLKYSKSADRMDGTNLQNGGLLRTPRQRETLERWRWTGRSARRRLRFDLKNMPVGMDEQRLSIVPVWPAFDCTRLGAVSRKLTNGNEARRRFTLPCFYSVIGGVIPRGAVRIEAARKCDK